jgi:hypothetical protein
MTMNNIRELFFQCPAKTLLIRISGFLDIVDTRNAHRSIPEASNPFLQSFEGIFKSLVEQVGVNLSCIYRCMSECLLNDKDVRGSGIQSGCEAVPKRMGCDSFSDSGFDNPLVEATLDLSCCNSFLHLAEKECLAFGEDLLTCLQIVMQNCSHLRVEKAVGDLTAFGFDGDFLFQNVNVSDIQVNQLGQSNAGMQEEIDDYQITVCLPALLQSDSFEKNAFFILCQKDRRFSVLVFDLDTNSWIMIDLASVGQPPEEALDRSSGAIDGRCHFRLSIGLLLHRITKEEAVDVSGCDLLDIAANAILVEQQVQIALLGSNRVRRPTVGKLVIQKVLYCLFDCQVVLLFMFMESHVQQCHVKPRKSRLKKEINATVIW